jgi:hypothetical protein
MKKSRNLCNPLLKSLPAVGRYVIKKACSSFSEISDEYFQKPDEVNYIIKSKRYKILDILLIHV